ncbi:MAG: hypothetical protein KC777_23835, partial [Cyanobacteria bacterium HKST-UBA02]|nr:hypothetical protein [Cyanobacteria bacterium HKST-UBA02]
MTIKDDQPVKELHLEPGTFIAGATVCGAVAMLLYFGLAVSQGWTPAASINLLAVLIQEQILHILVKMA